MQQNRDVSFDAFRGLAIAAVVAAHTTGTVFSEGYSSVGSKWNFFLLLAYVQILLFTVPALIFMTGYWSAKRPINSLQDYRIFLTKKLSRVLIPYLFWSLVILGYSAIKTQQINPDKIILKLLTGGACYPYYFVIAITQLYIITPLLQYINRKQYGLILVLIFSIVSYLALYLSRVFNIIIWPLPIYLPFYSWVIYYEIGLLMGTRRNKIIDAKNIHIFILPAALVSLLLSEIEAMVLLSKYNNLYLAISPVKYSTFLYSVCIIIVFLHVRRRLKYQPKLLATIGNYSFGLYLIHVPVLNQVVNLVQKSSTIYSFQPLYQFVVVTLTILICLVIINITRRLLPTSFCVKVLGF